MSLRLEIALTPRSRELLRRLEEMPEDLVAEIRKVLDRENQLTVGHIMRSKLSRRGGRTLGVRTNRLRGSIRATRARASGRGEITASIGTNVKYAGVHEFGFRGRVSVRAHQRRQPATVFGKPNPNVGQGYGVRAHSRNVVFPKRAPIATGIQERSERYSRALSAAIERVLGGEG